MAHLVTEIPRHDAVVAAIGKVDGEVKKNANLKKAEYGALAVQRLTYCTIKNQ